MEYLSDRDYFEKNFPGRFIFWPHLMCDSVMGYLLKIEQAKREWLPPCNIPGKTQTIPQAIYFAVL